MNVKLQEAYEEAKACAKSGHFRDVIKHLSEAVRSIDISRPLEDVEQKAYGMLGNAHIKSRQPKAAISLLKPLHDSARGNTVTTNTLANAYLHDGQPKAAISLLKPLHDSARGDTVTTATLANAYLHDGQPKAAISLLKPLHDSARGDTVTTATLANAYAITKNQAGFDTIKADINPPDLKDYLQAKLYYLNNQSGEALKVLKPYIVQAQNIRDIPANIMSVYLSSIGDESPVLEHIKAAAGDDYFSFLLRRRDSWRADPLRTELANDPMFSSQTLWELGGTPASTQDRNSLGLTPAQGALVAVKKNTPSFG